MTNKEHSKLLAAAAASDTTVASVVSDSVRPHGLQPTRLRRPWDSPGKNTGVGCHFLLQCMKVESAREVAQSCLTLSDPMDCSLPGSSIHGIFRARVLEWVPLPSPSKLLRRAHTVSFNFCRSPRIKILRKDSFLKICSHSNGYYFTYHGIL